MSALEGRIAAVARTFAVGGRLKQARPWGSGNINDTYAATFEGSGRTFRLLFQMVNTGVFKEPERMMDNVARVTAHLRAKGSRTLRAPALLRAPGGELSWSDSEGGFWRVFELVEGSRSVDVLDGPMQAREAGRAFGEFARLLADLGPPRLHETLPAFHNVEARCRALEEAARADVLRRAASAGPELEFAREARAGASGLDALRRAGVLPERVAHNDTKVSNVLFEGMSERAVAVVDLDTVMPGLLAHDFGDLIRGAASAAPEDERDLGKVSVRRPVFWALAEGYLGAVGGLLTAEERASLAMGPRVIAFELGVRFLTDYLRGDVYFKTHRENHNLDRCRVQFRLADLLQREESDLGRLIESVRSS